MKYLYLTANDRQFLAYRALAKRFIPQLEEYAAYLRDYFAVTDLPRCVIFADECTITRDVSDLPIPAFTNDYRILFTPEVETWKRVYLRQLEAYDAAHTADLRAHYEQLDESHVLQILGHEYAHHSDNFLDEVWEDENLRGAIWFEEGMAEYISRTYFLTACQLERDSAAERKLMTLYEEQHGRQPLEQFFSAETYSADHAAIFYAYWRAFSAVEAIVRAHDGDVDAVFAEYHRWYESAREIPLSSCFLAQKCFSEHNGLI